MTALRIAVVGTGARARAHLGVIPRMSDLYTLVGVADADAERRAAAASEYAVPGFATVEDLLDETKPDVLYVIVPPDGHHVLTEAAASRGVHVISETPIATTLEMADAMAQSAKRNGVKLEVAEQVGRGPMELMKRKIVEAGLIGKVLQVHLCYTSGAYHGISVVRNIVQAAPTRALGMTLPVEPPTRISQPKPQHWEHALIEFDNGVICIYDQPVHGGPRRNYNRWEILGTEGYISGNDLVFLGEGEKRWEPDRFPIEQVMEERDGQEVLVALRVATDPEIVWENPYRRYGLVKPDQVAVVDILAGMHRAITQDTEPPYGAASARCDQEILIALRESARLGSVWVDMPLIDKTGIERAIDEAYRVRYGHNPMEALDAQAGTHFPQVGTVTIHGAHTS